MSDTDSTIHSYDGGMNDATETTHDSGYEIEHRVNVDSILTDAAHAIGVPVESLTGNRQSPPVIEMSVKVDRRHGELNTLSYIPDGTRLGMVECSSTGGVVRSGIPPQRWKPPIHISDAEISAILIEGCAKLRKITAHENGPPVCADEPETFYL